MSELHKPSQDIQLWLEMLADGELGDRQVTALVRYLDGNPALWRRCAVTLLNEQTLSSALTVKHPGPLPVRREAVTKRFPRLIMVACAALLAGFLLHGLVGYQLVPARLSPNLVTFANPVDQWRPTVWNGFGGSKGPNALVEIEDTPERAVYFVDYAVPKFLIEAIVMAGHSVEIKQDSTSIVGPSGQPLEIPINTLEIKKYANPTF